MDDYISDGQYGSEKQFPKQIQDRIDAGIGCGSSIGKGWLPLVVELDEKLNKLIPDYRIDQIKEKFGGLRFYTNAVTDECYELISEAENKSYEICDICGSPGDTKNSSGWIVTRCEQHKGR